MEFNAETLMPIATDWAIKIVLALLIYVVGKWIAKRITRVIGKLMNKAEDVVRESIEGMAIAHKDLLKVNLDPNFIYRADAPVSNKVSLVSGCGSGHEPMHGGFVGKGMLDAACPGEVFTSPTPDQMLAAAKAD